MALKKEQYDYRRESAASRNADNEEIAVRNGMEQEQAELITKLCSMRHDLHCSTRDIASGDESGMLNELVSLNIRIKESGFTPMDFVPSDEEDFIDIDSIDLLKEMGETPDSDSDEYNTWLADTLDRIERELCTLNDKIEDYLRNIDQKYSTQFAPTGALRM